MEGKSLETLDEVTQLLQKLPEKERSVVKLYFIEGRSYEEISKELAIPINSIGPILSRALRSDSISVTVDRQERSPKGDWKPSPIARDAVAELESAILLRARHIRAERYRDTS